MDLPGWEGEPRMPGARFTSPVPAGFDPTNGIVGNRDLIRVAVARAPSQAIPLFGTYWGDREDELGMDVEVNVKTAGAYS